MQSSYKKDFKAIHTQDLEDVLKKFHQYEDFLKGNLHCWICNDIITLQNIGSVKFIDRKLTLSCNKQVCYEQAVKETK